MIVQKLYKRGLITPPKFLPDNVHYQTMMGSIAYGVSGEASDIDIYGFVIPPKAVLFPHLDGYIPGFGKRPARFDQYQEHHIQDKASGKEYDISIYNIVKYFQLCMENNPNMLDSLFTPQNCVLQITAVGQLVRDNRKMFLHKGCWHKYKGYAMSQLHKMKGVQRSGKRKEVYEKYGFDLKMGYHLVRLLLEAEMILNEQDLDLMRHKEHLKAIRRGDISEQEIREWAASKEKSLESAYENSTLQYKPDEDQIKTLLLQCLESHYGSLDKAVLRSPKLKLRLRRLLTLLTALGNSNTPHHPNVW